MEYKISSRVCFSLWILHFKMHQICRMQHRQHNINVFFLFSVPLSLSFFLSLKNVFSTPENKFALVFRYFVFRLLLLLLLLSFIRSFVVSFSLFFSRCWDFLCIQSVCACVCVRVLLQSFSRFFLSIRDFLFIFNFIFGRFDAFFRVRYYIFLFFLRWCCCFYSSLAVDVNPNSEW